MSTLLIVVVGSIELRFTFLLVETPPNPLLNFVTDPISTPFLTTSMLGATTISTPMVIILALGDFVTPTPTYYLWVSTTVASDTIGGTVLI
jgi:hypothetical protein